MSFSTEDLNTRNSNDNLEYIIGFLINQNPTNIISNISQLPKEIITQPLNLSFFDLAVKLNNCEEQLFYWLEKAGYLEDVAGNKPQNIERIYKIQNYIRRILSNFCNNPDNITDSKNNYIGQKYGLRMSLIANDGWILHNIETFCQDVKNAGPTFANGKNNNYISYVATNTEIPSTNIYYNPSNISFNSTINSTTLYALQSSSTDLPTTLPVSNILNYILIGEDGKPTEEVPPAIESIVSNQILDNHGTRYEVQLSRSSLYGYVCRRSDTDSKFNYYVCKNLGVPPFKLLGTEYSLRLSFFEW